VPGDTSFDGLAQVLPQVESVGDLRSIGCSGAGSFGIGTGSVRSPRPPDGRQASPLGVGCFGWAAGPAAPQSHNRSARFRRRGRAATRNHRPQAPVAWPRQGPAMPSPAATSSTGRPTPTTRTPAVRRPDRPGRLRSSPASYEAVVCAGHTEPSSPSPARRTSASHSCRCRRSGAVPTTRSPFAARLPQRPLTAADTGCAPSPTTPRTWGTASPRPWSWPQSAPTNQTQRRVRPRLRPSAGGGHPDNDLRTRRILTNPARLRVSIRHEMWARSRFKPS
jgi:hypothetical protein